jgi:TetR/AcrR family transcriptional repressor of nem operon
MLFMGQNGFIMGRTQEFDPNDALQTATNLFLEKGYYDSSVDEVVKRSGVAKYGIYGTFGPKRELFKKVLAQFTRNFRQNIQLPLRKPDASLPAVVAFFKEVPKRVTNRTRHFLRSLPFLKRCPSG